VILHPGIWSLMIGSGLVLLMLLYSSAIAVKIAVYWDYQSSTASQLSLERKTYLISVIVQFVLFFEIIAALLFVYTIDDIHSLFIGAMCATGVLNANPIGWSVLGVKILLFFVAACWLALNAVDHKSEEYPLTRLKYLALLFLLPLVGLDFYLQLRYFNGLQPEFITSCCGSLFSAAGNGVGSELAGLPVRMMMWFFYLTSFVFAVLALLSRKLDAGVLRYILLLVSIFWFFVALASIISFISLYIYEIPTHHCPFDMFQANYNYIGYPVYICLFGATYYGILPGLFEPLKRMSSLSKIIRESEKKSLAWAFFFLVCFVIIISLPIVIGEFTLEGYY
jgi:hypothetical protein